MRTIIVTGGNTGLGLETVKFLSKDPNTYLVIASRNLERTKEIAKDLNGRMNEKRIMGLTLHLGDFDSIKSFVSEFKSLEAPPLYGIINNAGIQYVSKTQYTKQGYEKTFGINHLGHFVLTKLLLPLIQDQGRIINVASGVHKPGMTKMIPVPRYTSASQLAFPKNKTHVNGLDFQGKERYSTSKLCNVLFTYKLSSELNKSGTSIKVFAFDPGMMPGTGLAQDYPTVVRFIWNNIMPVLTLFGDRTNTPKQSARVLANWMLDNSVDKQTTYFYVGGEENSSEESYDPSLQSDLWSFSMKELHKHLLYN